MRVSCPFLRFPPLPVPAISEGRPEVWVTRGYSFKPRTRSARPRCSELFHELVIPGPWAVKHAYTHLYCENPSAGFPNRRRLSRCPRTGGGASAAFPPVRRGAGGDPGLEAAAAATRFPLKQPEASTNKGNRTETGRSVSRPLSHRVPCSPREHRDPASVRKQVEPVPRGARRPAPPHTHPGPPRARTDPPRDPPAALQGTRPLPGALSRRTHQRARGRAGGRARARWPAHAHGRRVRFPAPTERPAPSPHPTPSTPKLRPPRRERRGRRRPEAA